MRCFLQSLRRFARDDKGGLFVEAIVVLPFLLWAYIGLFVYWDAFRSINTVQKSAYAVADMISREMLTLTPGYLAGMDSIMERLIDDNQDVSMRVTSVYYDLAQTRNEVHWSLSPGSTMPPLTHASLQDYNDQIPNMSDGDYVIIVEVAVPYTPSFNVGVRDMNLQQFIVTRPRFVPKICMEGYPCT